MTDTRRTRSPEERRRRWNRGLWLAFAVVLATQLWPVRELGNQLEPFVGPLPLTVAWHLAAVGVWIVIYLLWMSRVWTPEAAELEEAGLTGAANAVSGASEQRPGRQDAEREVR